MTFIASVIAKNGIVVLADSLTTIAEPMLSLADIDSFANDTDITKDSLKKLIKYKPVYSHQNAEKLFELDKHTILTTAGLGMINDMLIKDLVSEFKNTYTATDTLDIRKKSFIDFLRVNSLAEIAKNKIIHETNFILSCFNPQLDLFEIYDIKIASTTEGEITADANLQFITSNNLTTDKVVCDGQTRLMNKLLLGSSFDAKNIIQAVVDTMINNFFNPKPSDTEIADIIEKIVNLPSIQQYLQQQKEISHIRDLEIQEAVDFICLLYKMVVDFQKYSNMFPNVGGNVKVGIIRKGIDFEIITTNKIKIPDYIE